MKIATTVYNHSTIAWVPVKIFTNKPKNIYNNQPPTGGAIMLSRV